MSLAITITRRLPTVILGRQKVHSCGFSSSSASVIRYDYDKNKSGRRCNFFRRLQELKWYKDEHGDTLVPRKCSEFPQLGIWVKTQRTQYKRKQRGEASFLTDERVDKLNGIGFVWDPNGEAWEERFQELKRYKDAHGDTLVPRKCSEFPQLGVWVKMQRTQYKRKQRGKASFLTNERVHKLNEIGFVWDPNGDAWEERFQELKRYNDVHGDTLVPAKYSENPQLGVWVNTQRTQYQRKQRGEASFLTDERVDKLNEIGFVWDPNGDAWEERFQELKRYKDAHGDTLVPRKCSEFPQLGVWVKMQRTQYKRKQRGEASFLTDERVDKLNEIGFVWDPNGEAWLANYNELFKFYEEHGHTKIPLPTEQEDKKFYVWCMRQRYSKAEGKLKRDRCDLLKKINFDFSILDVSKGSSLIEKMIIYELERKGHEFNMTNKVFCELKKYRPDMVIFVDDTSVIFVEVDEKYHSRSCYPIQEELGRMDALKEAAERKGCKQVAFIRIGTGDERVPNSHQLAFVSDLLYELKHYAQLNPFSVHYIDYPKDHHHVLACLQQFDEVHVLSSQ